MPKLKDVLKLDPKRWILVQTEKRKRHTDRPVQNKAELTLLFVFQPAVQQKYNSDSESL